MGSIGIMSLTTRRNRRFFISAEHYPVVKLRPHRSGTSRRADPRVERRLAIRCSVACRRVGRTRIRGSMMARASGPEVLFVTRVVPRSSICGGGGDEETRTPDPLLAKEMLYQLSYVPAPGREWWAFLDSNQRPLPYQGSALTS